VAAQPSDLYGLPVERPGMSLNLGIEAHADIGEEVLNALHIANAQLRERLFRRIISRFHLRPGPRKKEEELLRLSTG
jgi:hypothetical protein